MFGIFVVVSLHVLQVFVDGIPIVLFWQGLGIAAVETSRSRPSNFSNSKETAARARRWQPVAQIESKVGAGLGAGAG